MDNTAFFLMLLLIITLTVGRARAYKWTKKKLLITVLVTYVIAAFVTFTIL